MSTDRTHSRFTSIGAPRLVALLGLLLALAVLLAPARALAATCDTSWATATSGLWSDASDWTNGIPTTGENVCIQVPGSYTVTLNGSGASVSSVTIGNASGAGTQELLVQAQPGFNATLTTAVASTVNQTGELALDTQTGAGYSMLTGAELDNYGQFSTVADGSNDNYIRANLVNESGATATLSGITNLADEANTITNDGTFTVSSGSSLTLDDGSGEFVNSGALTNSGSILLEDDAGWTQSAGSAAQSGNPVEIFSSGLLTDVSGAGSFDLVDSAELTGTIPAGQTVTGEAFPSHNSNVVLSGASGQVINDGTFVLDSPTGGGTDYLTGTGETFVNNGTFDVTSQTGNPVYMEVPLVNNGGATVEVKAANLNQYENTTTTNDGLVRVDSGAEYEADAGSALFANDGSVVNNGTFSLIDGSSWTQNGPESGNPVEISSGTLTDQSGGGSFELYDGPTLIGTIPSGQTVTADAIPGHNSTVTISGTVTNHGTLALSSPSSGGQAALVPATTAAVIDNYGSMTSDAVGTTTAYLETALVNESTGTVEVQAGTFNQYEGTTTTNDGLLQVDAQATFEEDDGGALLINNGSVTNNGTITLIGGSSWTQSAGSNPQSGAAIEMSSGTLTDTSGGGSFELYDNPTLIGTIPAGQTVTAAAISGHNSEVDLGGGSVTNDGTLILDERASGGEAELYPTTATLINNGTLDSQSENGATTTYLEVGLTNSLGASVEVKSGILNQYEGTTTTNDGTFTVDSGATFEEDDGTAVFANSGSVADDGTITLLSSNWTQNGTESGGAVEMSSGTLTDESGGGSFELYDGPTLIGTIPAGQTVTADAIPGHNSSVTLGGGTVTNDGTLLLDEPTGGGYVQLIPTSATLVNNGTLDSESAEGATALTYLEVNLTNNAGATTEVESGTFTQYEGTTTTNNGLLQVDSGGTFQGDDGSALIANNGAVTNNGSISLVDSSNWTQNAGSAVQSGNPVYMSSGTLTDESGGGQFDLYDGPTLKGTIPAGQTVVAAAIPSHDSTLTLGGSGVTNDGTLTLDAQANGGYVIVNGSSLTNGGTLQTQVEGSGPDYLRTNVANTTAGTIQLVDGTLEVDEGNTLTNDGTVEIEPGAVMNMTDSADVFTNKADGTLQPDLASATSFGVIHLSSGATFTPGGTIFPNLVGGYAPPVGTEFDVITGPTTGSFATVANNFLGDYSNQTNYIAVKRDRDSTTTTLTAAPNPSTYGQPVTLTATITPGQGPVGNPTGTVTFTDGSTVLGTGTVSTTAGVTTATLTTTVSAPLPVGTDSITATYGGDSNFKPSPASSPTSEVVNKALTTTTVAASASPITFGQSDTYTATVTGPTGVLPPPSGTVTFTDGSTTLGTGTLSTTGGVTTATFTATQPAVGSHSISASYGGDGNYLASTTTTPAPVTVNKAPTTVSLQTSGTPSIYGSQVTFTATVAGPTGVTPLPSGTVTFTDGSTTLGTGTISTSSGSSVATFSTTALAVGTHSITASYSGDGNYLTSGPSSPATSQVVNKAPTTVTVAASGSPITFGQGETYTATVSGPNGVTPAPTGTVTFTDGSTTLGTGTLSTTAGVTTATFTVLEPSVGAHSIAASYGGDGNYLGSATTTPASVTVNPASTTTAVGTSGSPAAYGSQVTFTSTVAGPLGVLPAPTGTVTFSDSSGTLGTGTLTTMAGITMATFSTSSLAPGTYSISASYGGDGNYTASSSSTPAAQVISPAPTSLTTTLTIGGSGSTAGTSGADVTVVAGTPVRDAGTLAGALSSNATGSVSYSVYSDSACTQQVATVTGGTVTGGVVPSSASETLNTPGTYYWVASYGGDPNNAPSTSMCGSEIETVNPPALPTTLTTSLSGDSQSGGSITVPPSTAVSDSATLAGTNAGTAGGSVTYKVYSDSACQDLVTTVGTVTVSAGAVPSSSTESFAAPGTYYWQASYTGDSLNESSTSVCGSEVETVSTPVTTTTTTTSSPSSTTSTTTSSSSTSSSTTTPTTTTSSTTTTTHSTTTTTSSMTTPTTTTTHSTTTTTSSTTTPTTTTTHSSTTTTSSTPTTSTTTSHSSTTTSTATTTTKTTTTTTTARSVAPKITIQPTTTTVPQGATATFTAAASGTPTPTVQWQVSTNDGFTWTNIPGATAGTLTLTNVPYSAGGNRYRAVFTNSAGSATTNAATLLVTLPAGTPTVTGLYPNRASAGSIILVFGSNFGRATAVDFGTKPAFFFAITNDIIVAQVPNQASGTVDVTVHTATLASPIVSADQFTFTPGRPTLFGFAARKGGRARAASTKRAARVGLTATQIKKIRAFSHGKVHPPKMVTLHRSRTRRR